MTRHYPEIGCAAPWAFALAVLFLVLAGWFVLLVAGCRPADRFEASPTKRFAAPAARPTPSTESSPDRK